MKKILSLAIAAALVAPAAVMADASLYGKAHFILANTDDSVEDVWSVDSIDSRFGVKGSEDLGNGLKAVYKFEFGVNPDSSSTLSNRNQYAGLAGGFGTVLMGRHDTPLKMSQGKFDQFGDVPGDIKGVMPGEDRLSDVLAYVSPSMSGFSFVGAAVAGEQGDTAGDLTGIADHISLAGLYSNGPIYGALAYNTYDLGGNADVDPALMRATFIWKGDVWQAGVMYSSMDFDGAADDADQVGVSGYFKVGSGKIKAQYLMGDSPTTKVSSVLTALGAPSDFDPNVKVVEPAGNNEVEQFSIGYEHSLSKQTTLHAGYTAYEEDSGAEEDTFFAGMIHKF
jgi:predicted porin